MPKSILKPIGLASAVLAGVGMMGAAPPPAQPESAQALADATVDALKAKDNRRALDLSARALALQPNVNNLFVHGTACGNVEDWPCAITDLEKAKAMATAGGADAQTLNAIDTSTVIAFLFGGRAQAGLDLARQLKKRDPASSVHIDEDIAAYFNQAAVAKVKAGDFDGATADLERGAELAPGSAVRLYVQAANIVSAKPPVDWHRVVAEAGKALAIDPENALANYTRGIATANSGDKASAVPFLQKARANAGNDASLRAAADAALKRLGLP